MTFYSGKNRSGDLLRNILVTAILLLAVTSLKAQTGSVNFSGSWAFNEAKSSPAQGGFRMGGGSYVITQDGNNLTVENTRPGRDGQEVTTTSKYTLDGKECSNTVFNNTVRKSVVTWSADGKSLGFSHTMNFEMNGESREFKSTEAWKINDADKTFIIETVFNGQNGEVKTTNVFDKK